MENIQHPRDEKPPNGIPGLKYWRHDLLAGLQVSLLALPLSLGVALASGAPPVAAMISAVIAGVAFPLLGGTYITIGGPAVGLAPASLAGIFILGEGNVDVGYPLFLVAVCLSGAIQVLLSKYDIGRLAMYFPSSVLQGMLMAIGILIITHQIPALLGHSGFYYTRDISEAFHRLPEQISDLNVPVFSVGVIGLIILFLLNSSLLNKYPWVRTQSPLLVVLWGVVAGWVMQIPDENLISVPSEILTQGVQFPQFTAVWAQPELWFALSTTVIILTLINATESLATIRAIDKIDPFKRRSNPNITLRTVGVSTMLSGLAGGLMIIPGGIKSTANVFAGGRTLWANAHYAGFMAMFLWFGTELINRIPVTVLAALLIFIGWRLCAPIVFFRLWAIGREQILIAGACVIGTIVTSNLLLGVLLGVAAKMILLCRDVLVGLTLDRRFRAVQNESLPVALMGSIKELFRDPVIRIGDGRAGLESPLVVTESGGHMKHPYKIYLSSVSCMNVMKLEERLELLLAQTQAQHTFLLIFRGYVVDHTAMEYVHYFRERCHEAGHRCIILGKERFVAHSQHALAYRVTQMHDSMAYV
ncbi:MAG TPA: SulP family inorganic anion transporter [Nitrospira sp.]|nr:SulP family inorganic anion transporter [Nitrospira sp.]